ncbi:MAG: trypsin-like serine protease [Massilia sp.]
MTIELSTALSAVEQAAAHIFDADARVRSVGVGRTDGGYGFVAVRNIQAPVALSARINKALPATLPTVFAGIPIRYSDSTADPAQLARVPISSAARAALASTNPEQHLHHSLACGLEIQNYDHDLRTGEIARGYVTIGTLGCFVRLGGANIGLLSNNHVLAGENWGQTGDRVAHPGDIALAPGAQIATLTRFVALLPSPSGATIAGGTAVLNDSDAAVAALQRSVSYEQKYLDGRAVPLPRDIAQAQVGDRVFKVGRTTGLTFGTVAQVAAVVGPIAYAPGPCWFRQNIVIESDDGKPFSNHGDSGSVIVREDGKVVGLLYAGNDTQTYACDIAKVFAALDCQLA